MRARQASVADVIPFSWVDGPGNRFVLFLQGCNFNCLACHNPQTIPVVGPRDSDLTVEDVLTRVRASMPYISGVTVSGGEATLQHEFLVELFSSIKADPELGGLTTFIDSNGSAAQAVWEALAPVTDGVMVDLKVLNAERHLELTGESNAAVLESIRFLAGIGLLYEVRLLLVPGQNDSEAELAATARWLRTVDPGIRVKVNSFMTHGVRAAAREWAVPSAEELARYRSTLIHEGIAAVR
jgi:pyruvate-formate lyase-activating enzyme